MRSVLQRVSHASVSVEGKLVGEIGKGIVALISVETRDTEEDSPYRI